MTDAHGAEAVISLDGISYRYGGGPEGGGFLALRDVSLTINRGEFVAILGTSGSGKSTLMNLLGSLATTTEGALTIAGDNPAALTDEGIAALRNRRIGFIFQQFHLLPRLTALENVLLPATYAVADDLVAERQRLTGRALALLDRLGIADQAHKMPATLSGGQKQRVAIARALLMDPEVLLADEPTGALDSRTSAEVLRIFAELNAEGRTIILITHDPDAAGVARRRIEMRDGRIVSDKAQTGQTAAEIAPAPPPAGTHPAALSRRQRLAAAFRSRIAPMADAWQALFSSRLRTLLTSLGLIIGVASITLMITLGSAAQEVILAIFARAGTDRIYVGLDFRAARTSSPGFWRGLDVRSELPALQNTFAAYGRIIPLGNSSSQSVYAGGNSFEARIQTVDSAQDMLDKGAKITSGRMIAPHEFRTGSRVVLVGSDFARELWPETYEGRRNNPAFPVGERLSLRGRLQFNATVVGVISPLDTTFESTDVNMRVYMPMNTAVTYTGENRVTWMAVVPHEGIQHRWLADSVVNYLSLISGLKYPFRSHVPEEMINRIMVFVSVFQALTAVIAGLCILVGGIGIMNIMLVTITERVKEIGLRKAVGASGRAIRRQFLAECTLLCTASGLVGTFIGFAFCNLVAVVGHALLPETIPSQLLLNPVGLTAGLGTAVLCGYAFGMVPAVKASRLDPSEALRSE